MLYSCYDTDYRRKIKIDIITTKKIIEGQVKMNYVKSVLKEILRIKQINTYFNHVTLAK